MAAPIVFAPESRLIVTYSTHEFRDSVKPFIAGVSNELSRGSTLTDAVHITADRHPDLAQYFVIDSDSEHSFALRDSYLLDDWRVTGLSIRDGNGARYNINLTRRADALPALNEFLTACSAGTNDRHSASSSINAGLLDLFESMREHGILIERDRRHPNFASAPESGVYRLQHASLLYRSATTGILVDPHLHSTYGSRVTENLYRDDLEGKVDAILISHFHEDHWFLSTLLMFDRHTPIVVPKVPRSSVICGDMKSLLEQCGFVNVIAADWYSAPIRIGDIEISVLPFYGEQALRFETPRHSDVRNWGNTYVVKSDQFTSWFLIDSGADAAGSMMDVASHVRRVFGKVDFLLSNLRPFNIWHPFYINDGLNWLTLSAAQMREFSSMQGHCITLGPSGVAEICATVGARYYLPYAHWFGDLGHVGDVGLDTPGQTEMSLLEALSAALARHSAGTAIVPWRIGDSFTRTGARGFERATLRA